ncbi:MAG: hypothetical protein KGY45_03885 [Hadesarchaea archaeon]|nr:hypothetical protein [Hadesarchaea archaeon]
MQFKKLKSRLLMMNWFGIIAGVLMLILPFLGPWWRASVGTKALEIGISPFYYHVSILGQELSSTLVSYFILAAQLTLIIGGVLMILGSLAPEKWWSKKIVRFGAMKIFWFLIILLALLLVGAYAMNNFLPGLAMNATGTEGVTLDLQALDIQVPYITGTTTSTLQASGITIAAPIHADLTPMFWLAVITAGLGIIIRIYHGRLTEEPETEEKEEKSEEKEEEEIDEKELSLLSESQ